LLKSAALFNLCVWHNQTFCTSQWSRPFNTALCHRCHVDVNSMSQQHSTFHHISENTCHAPQTSDI